MPGEKKDANESDDEYEVERVVDYQFCKQTVRRRKKKMVAASSVEDPDPGSGAFSTLDPDPESGIGFFRIPYLGSRIQKQPQQKRGVKKN